MDPITSSVSALHATYQLILFSVDVDQVPSQVRRSLELVQTCHRDLQHLIEIRNECLHLLEKTPIVLNRVNEIIAAADKGLIEVCQIVEKCRPDANNGKVPFKNRVGWVLFDSREFRAQEPVISRHHAAVLSELNFLRQTALLAPQLQQQKPAITTEIKKGTEIFDNVALLGGLMGEMAFSGTNSHQKPSFSSEAAILTSPVSAAPKSTVPFPHFNPPQHPTYPSAPNPANPPTVAHEPYCELEAPFGPFPGAYTSRPNAASRAVPQGPIYHPAMSQARPTAFSSSNDLGLLSFEHGNQTRDSVLEYSSTASTLGLSPPTRPTEFDHLSQLAPSSSSTPSIRSARDSVMSQPVLPAFADQPSEPGELEKEGHNRYSKFSGYFRRSREIKPDSITTRDEGSSANLRHVNSAEGMFPVQTIPARSNTKSSLETPTGRWFSPDSIHVFSNPNPSNATLDSEAPTLIPPSPTFTNLGTMSTLSLNTLPSETSFNLDDDFDRIALGNPSTCTIPRVATPRAPNPKHSLPHQPRHASTEPIDLWKPADRSGVPKSVSSRSQSESSNPAIIFGSAFWGPNAVLDAKELEPPLKRSHTDGEEGLAKVEANPYSTLGSVPDFMEQKHSRHQRSHSELVYHKAAHANSYELSPANYVPDVAELP
ncbi:hypothetical protein CCHR01_00320 [Colletotrichum chrysophilum]|uniref:Uncharacterized protein n=1 Tax=Colletotrichum chrysophilum TaxID=1836956 RepID=A0AAD9B001_9PEZI|nr:hypothetical protein CCHR01_00320 [Colletotrichum chrysophilum]